MAKDSSEVRLDDWLYDADGSLNLKPPVRGRALLQPDTGIPSVAILMTCFNRRDTTLRCLEEVFSQTEQEPRTVSVFLVDDASKDGTVEAVQNRFPQVNIFHGNGSLFWNRGMHFAFAEALKGDFDYFLWLNDDTLLFSHAFDTLLAAAHKLESSGVTAIITGSTQDTRTGLRSYGGIRLVGTLRRHLVPVDPSADRTVSCDTMNGNCTLIPRAIARTIGNLDATFHHSFGDLDYGFRASKAGFSVYVAPGFLGTCSDNGRVGTWRDLSAPLKVRWRHLNSAKGSPFGEWVRYCRRHMGPIWPFYALSPYVKTLTASILHRP